MNEIEITTKSKEGPRTEREKESYQVNQERKKHSDKEKREIKKRNRIEEEDE